MITYKFTSVSLSGQTIKVQYSKYNSNVRIDLGSGTFPFEYTTDQKGGTYYFYIPSIDRTFPKNIDIPPVDIYTEEINVPDCDLSGVTIFVPPCDVTGTTIFVPVCDIDYDVMNIIPTPTPTITPTQTGQPLITPTPTITNTPSVTSSNTPTPSITPTNTPTPSTTPIPELSLLQTFTESGFLINDTVVSSNPRIFAFGNTGSTATTFVYSAASPYTAITSFSGISGSSSLVTAEITNTYIYKASDGEYLVEVIDVSNYTATTLTISGFNDSWLSSYDSSANKIAIMSMAGNKLFFVDTTNNSTSEFSLTGSSYGYKGGMTNDGGGKFYIVGNVGKLSVIENKIPPQQVTYDIYGSGEYQKITWVSTNSKLFIYSRDFIYVYGQSGGLTTTINISSYSADTQAATASIIYNPDNDRIYVAFADVTNNLVVLKIKTDYTVEASKSDYGITVGASLKLKYNSNTGLVLTVNSSSFYLINP